MIAGTRTAAALVALALGFTGFAAGAQDPDPEMDMGAGAPEGTVTPEVVEQINMMLAEMQCEMDPGNIEVEDGGYELDDVYCADGQYDIELDAGLNEVSRRKE